MNIISLFCLQQAKSKFHKSTYVAFVAPAWAGNHINEIIIMISQLDLEDYSPKIFESKAEAERFAEIQTFGS